MAPGSIHMLTLLVKGVNSGFSDIQGRRELLMFIQLLLCRPQSVFVDFLG